MLSNAEQVLPRYTIQPIPGELQLKLDMSLVPPLYELQSLPNVPVESNVKLPRLLQVCAAEVLGVTVRVGVIEILGVTLRVGVIEILGVLVTDGVILILGVLVGVGVGDGHVNGPANT